MRADQTASLKPEALTMDASGDAGVLSVNVSRLKGLSSQFTEIDRITEESFLALGRHVNHFHQRAGEISASTVHALQLLEGDSGEQALMRLQLLIERCSLWLDDAQSQTAQIVVILENIVSRMSRMTTPLQGLRKLVKTLQGLRISTRIETARSPGSGAQVLADELKRLTEMIQDKVQQIEKQFDSLGALSCKMLEHQKQISRGPMAAAQRGIQENRQTLSCLSEQRVETGYRTEQLQSQSDKIAAHFGEMIIALQFQDITRQRLEHIQDALEDLSCQVELQSQASGLGNEEALLITSEVCRLQQEHLGQVLAEFDNAVNNLMLNLTDVVTSVRALTDETRRFDTASREVVGPEQSSDVALLQKVTDQLGIVLDLHMEARSTIRSVCGKVCEISSQVDAVEYIG